MARRLAARPIISLTGLVRARLLCSYAARPPHPLFRSDAPIRHRLRWLTFGVFDPGTQQVPVPKHHFWRGRYPRLRRRYEGPEGTETQPHRTNPKLSGLTAVVNN